MKMPWYSVCSFLLLFRTNVRKKYLDECDLSRCYANFFESAILKVTFSTIARHIDNSILKDTLELKILYGHGSIYVLIPSSRLEGAFKIFSCKKIRTCTAKNITPKQIMFHFQLYASFSIKQTQCLLTYWIAFVTVYSQSYLLINDILRRFEFHPVPLLFL